MDLAASSMQAVVVDPVGGTIEKAHPCFLPLQGFDSEVPQDEVVDPTGMEVHRTLTVLYVGVEGLQDWQEESGVEEVST